MYIGTKALGCTLAVVLAVALSTTAEAATLESWNNTSDATFDGWTTNLQPYTPSYSTTTGLTDGAAALAMTGTASPTYGQMLRSAFVQQYTTDLSNAQSVSFDVTTPSASFGFFLQWDFIINNNDTGFLSLDNSNYQSVSIGGTTTLTVPVSAATRAILAASSNPTQLIFQVGGGSSGNPQTFYLDNVRTTPAPEPTSMALLAIGGLMMARRRR